MSVFSFLDRDNAEWMFFHHIKTCATCKEVHADGWQELCRAGEQLMAQFKKTSRETVAA